MHSRIGVFLSPVNKPGQDPHLALHRNLNLVEMVDELNYDEAWFGEHNTLGWGLVGAPETMIAAAAQRTRQIKLANGVVPLSWHHPFHVATRAVHLDHLSAGRYVLGVGRGVLLDGKMLGLSPAEQASRFTEALPTVVELVNGESRVSVETDWYTLDRAKLQLPRFSPDGLDIAIASGGTSPNSPRLAGKYGLSLVSFALSQPGAPATVDLAAQWRYAEESAAEHGHTMKRENWRIAMPVHIAETREEAFADVREGFDEWIFDYFGKGAGRDVSTPGVPEGRELEARIDAGGAIVGSVDDAVAAVQKLTERTGGFGTLLVYVPDWCSWEKTDRSLQLLARYVAPHFTGSIARPQEAMDFAVASRG